MGYFIQNSKLKIWPLINSDALGTTGLGDRTALVKPNWLAAIARLPSKHA